MNEKPLTFEEKPLTDDSPSEKKRQDERYERLSHFISPEKLKRRITADERRSRDLKKKANRFAHRRGWK